jgi:hypothetical protein
LRTPLPVRQSKRPKIEPEFQEVGEEEVSQLYPEGDNNVRGIGESLGGEMGAMAETLRCWPVESLVKFSRDCKRPSGYLQNGAEKDLGSTMKSMARDDLLKRLEIGRYSVAENVDTL